MTKDLTSGKPMRLILSFMTPILLGNLFQQLYSLCDTIIVGRIIDFKAFSAVGATGSISFLILGFVQGLTSGFSVITSQRFGAGDEKGVRRSVAATVVLSTVFGAALTVISMFAAGPMLRLMNTPADLYDDAYIYIMVIYGGTLAITFYNMIANIVRALGDSRTPLIFLIFSSLLNIVLDIVMIYASGKQVWAAAAATVISQIVSALLCLVYVMKKFPILRISKSDFHFPKGTIGLHLKIAVPMGFQMSVLTIGMIAVQTVLNGFGSDTVGAFSAASKIEQLFIQPLVSLGTAMATYAAQNYGAGQYRRVKSGVRSAMLLTVIFTAVISVLVVGFGKYMVRLFAENITDNVLGEAQTYLNILVTFFIALGTLFVLRSVLQGLGSVSAPFAACVAELIMRIVAAFLFASLWGYTGVCFATPLAWVGAVIILIPAYFINMKKLLKTQPKTAVQS